MPIDDYRVSTRGGDISPLNISRLLFFDAESCFFTSAISAPFDKGQVGLGIELSRTLNRHKRT
jgi:hypothetical protein